MMTEAQAFMALKAALENHLTAQGAKTEILAGRQPTKQMLIDNAAYLFSISEEVQGVQGRKYSPRDGHSGHLERVRVSKTLQCQVFKKTSITDENEPTASDICALLQMIVRSLPFQESIRQVGIATHGVTAMREPEFINDAGDYEKNPSFDFVLSFTREINVVTPAVTVVHADLSGN